MAYVLRNCRECNVYVAFVEEKKLVNCNIFRSRKLKENKDIIHFQFLSRTLKWPFELQGGLRAGHYSVYPAAQLLTPFPGGEWIMSSQALNVDNMF